MKRIPLFPRRPAAVCERFLNSARAVHALYEYAKQERLDRTLDAIAKARIRFFDNRPALTVHEKKEADPRVAARSVPVDY
jgi:hypothetical protein